MSRIKALIVDDEELCIRGVRILLGESDEFEVVGECLNGREAIREIDEKNPDVVFLDIQMPEIDGFDVIKAVDSEKMPLIVFVTAYDEYAIKAFEVHAIDYILKPFTKARFNEALGNIIVHFREKGTSGAGDSLMKMISEWESRKLATPPGEFPKVDEYLDRILVSDKGSYRLVWVRDIEWIEGADYYVNLHSGDKSHLYRERLKNLETKLTPDKFIRVHKSAIINLDYLDRITADYKNQNYAIMKSGSRIKISKSRKKNLLDICKQKFGLKSEF